MIATPTKILVVDDEPPIRRLLRTSLQSEGFNVVEAESGRQALAEIELSTPDLVILDLGLPDIQGQDVIRIVRERCSSVPILVLSSRADETGKVEALDLGADDYVTMPFGTDELLARIRTALRHRLQQQGQLPVFRSGSERLRCDRQSRVHRSRRREEGGINDEEVLLVPGAAVGIEGRESGVVPPSSPRRIDAPWHAQRAIS